jgi:hypothetical protein
MFTRKQIISAFIALFFAVSCYAETEPQAVDWGSVKVIPTVKISEKYDDNIFNDDTNEEDAWITSIEPEVQFLSQQDANVYAFTYQGDYSFYSGSSDDDYNDHIFTADLLFDMSTRARLSFTGAYSFLTDPRGTAASEGIGTTRDEPDEYEESGLAVLLDLGSKGARFGVELGASATDIEYQNNREETAFRDRSETRMTATLFMRVAPKTRAFLEVSAKDLEYDENSLVGGSLDSEEESYMLGAEWEITGKTTGSIKVGNVDKDFDEASRGDDDFTSWDVDIEWSPRTYSTLFFSASKMPLETNGTGQFIENQETSVSWVHDWSDVLHSRASVSIGTDEFNQDPREDDIDRFSFGVNYDFRRWCNIGLDYSFEDKDSNDDFFDYERNIITLGFDLSL